ncbi:MAG TPA: CBS domain-containing protein, partial [Wenzhouxiangella sp.]|nr:CBS domain-containing protein [Wenzhouxiangella sp.]
MQPSENSDFLASVAPFSELPSEAIAPLASKCQRMHFKAGDRIGHFIQPGDHGIYVIVAGSADLKADDDHTLEQRGEGELFGHAIQFDGQACDYAVEAHEALELLYLSPNDLSELGRQYSKVARFFSDGPGARLREIGGQRPARLGELSLRAPVTGDPNRSISDIAALMSRHQISCMPLIEKENLVGIVTDRDLRNRVLGRSLDPARPIADVMTPNPVTVRKDHRIEDALVEMMRLGIHHLPVVDEEGRLASVI